MDERLEIFEQSSEENGDNDATNRCSWNALEILAFVVSSCEEKELESKETLATSTFSPNTSTKLTASVDASATEHRVSCHRCGNIRKRKIVCSRSYCPHIFCGRCADKMKDEHGVEVFSNGCPVCNELCCCHNKTLFCHRKNHCYRKCPATKTKNGASTQGNDNSQPSEESKNCCQDSGDSSDDNKPIPAGKRHKSATANTKAGAIDKSSYSFADTPISGAPTMYSYMFPPPFAMASPGGPYTYAPESTGQDFKIHGYSHGHPLPKTSAGLVSDGREIIGSGNKSSFSAMTSTEQSTGYPYGGLYADTGRYITLSIPPEYLTSAANYCLPYPSPGAGYYSMCMADGCACSDIVSPRRRPQRW